MSTTEPGILMGSPDLDSWNILFKLKVDGYKLQAVTVKVDVACADKFESKLQFCVEIS